MPILLVSTTTISLELSGSAPSGVVGSVGRKKLVETYSFCVVDSVVASVGRGVSWNGFWVVVVLVVVVVGFLVVVLGPLVGTVGTSGVVRGGIGVVTTA